MKHLADKVFSLASFWLLLCLIFGKGAFAGGDCYSSSKNSVMYEGEVIMTGSEPMVTIGLAIGDKFYTLVTANEKDRKFLRSVIHEKVQIKGSLNLEGAVETDGCLTISEINLLKN